MLKTSDKYHYFISVSFKNIKNVPFPAVTVCAPNSGKWPALVEALQHYDTDGQIFKTVGTMNNKSEYSGPFYMSFSGAAGQLFIEKFAPELILDHNLPAKLKLIPIEIEIFYLLHFGFYLECTP